MKSVGRQTGIMLPVMESVRDSAGTDSRRAPRDAVAGEQDSFTSTPLAKASRSGAREVNLGTRPWGTLPDPNGHLPVDDWSVKDPERDGVAGMSVDRAVHELDHKVNAKGPIVVAVIDSGVDTKHPDLLANLWRNTKEVPDNRRDDDANGFVDDLHGWNFLGGYDRDGKPVNVDKTTLEVTRELKRMKSAAEAGALGRVEQRHLYDVARVVREARAEAALRLEAADRMEANARVNFSRIANILGFTYEELSEERVSQVEGNSAELDQAKRHARQILAAKAQVERIRGYFGDQLNFQYNESFDPRAAIIGDDPYNTADRNYGNNDVFGPFDSALHGTHVSGIIAAERGNARGTEGVANPVQIMAIRAVPDGDEYDKDIANAVRYAVDNGAHVINMSFGKAYSPNKEAVDAAFRYAEERGVVIVHAAGNDGKNNDVQPSFPNKFPLNESKPFSNWIEVGASSSSADAGLPAGFSNFGKDTVDVFAPGVMVNAPAPGNNYRELSGTSMATPNVAGVAALLLLEHPDLKPHEVRKVLMETARQYPNLMVRQPNEEGKVTLVPFASLSVSGGVVDAYAALKAARVLRGK